LHAIYGRTSQSTQALAPSPVTKHRDAIDVERLATDVAASERGERFKAYAEAKKLGLHVVPPVQPQRKANTALPEEVVSHPELCPPPARVDAQPPATLASPIVLSEVELSVEIAHWLREQVDRQMWHTIVEQARFMIMYGKVCLAKVAPYKTLIDLVQQSRPANENYDPSKSLRSLAFLTDWLLNGYAPVHLGCGGVLEALPAEVLVGEPFGVVAFGKFRRSIGLPRRDASVQQFPRD
jgi:hypothetical protein